MVTIFYDREEDLYTQYKLDSVKLLNRIEEQHVILLLIAEEIYQLVLEYKTC